MQSVYTIFFNREDEVIPLRYCNGYSHAEELLDSVTDNFMKTYYTGLPRKTCDITLQKSEDSSNIVSQIYTDASFPAGIVFVRKRYDVVVYQKTCVSGLVRNTYNVKCLGRIGVMAQQYALSEQHTQLIDSLRATNTRQEQLIAQQEIMIRRLEHDIMRLEGVCGKTAAELEELRQALAHPQTDVQVYEIPQPPVPPRAPNQIELRKMSVRPVVGELKTIFDNADDNTVASYFEGVKERSLSKRKKIASDDLAIDALIADLDSISISCHKL